MKKKICALLLGLIIPFILVGCAQITEKEAESVAEAFILSKVKFFSSAGNSTSGIEDYLLTKTSYRQGDDWIVAIHVRSKLNSSKENDLLLKINRKGEVIEFNGAKVQS